MKVTALAQRSGEWWAVEVPEVEGAFTQAKRLDQIPNMVADAVGLLLEVDPADVEVHVEAHLNDDSLEQYVALTREAQAQALEAGQRASLASRAAVDLLRTSSYSTRDVAALLGVSHQRVSQIGAGVFGPSQKILDQVERALAPTRRIQDQVATAMAPIREMTDAYLRSIDKRVQASETAAALAVEISQEASKRSESRTRAIKKAAAPAKRAGGTVVKGRDGMFTGVDVTKSQTPTKRAKAKRSTAASG